MSDEETTDQATVSEGLRSVSSIASELERLADAGAGMPALPGYEVLSELGRGGMGVVYLARQLSLNRRVALKMIRSGELASEQERERFLIEAEAIARLQHPGIVQVYEVGTFNGCPFFALEYVEGGSLAVFLAGEPQPPRNAAAFVASLARAMQHAHERGIVHRDLKPANVLLAGEPAALAAGFAGEAAASPANPAANAAGSPTPKITDFGLAKLVDTDSGATATGAILGTPSYASPEQASGHARDAGVPADVYALGVILYEMLTGRPPFKGATSLETLEMVRTQEPVTPRQLMPRIARDLDTICLKCLHKNPARRYTSAAELADDLDRYLKGEPIRARRVGRIERLLKWTRRRPAATALILVCLAALAAGVFGVLAYQHDLGAALEAARNEAREKENALDRATHSLYASQLTHIGKVWQTDPWQALELLEDKERCPEELRDFAWGYYHRHSRRQVWMTKGHKREVYGLAFSADGELLYSGGPEGVRIWDASTGKSEGAFEGPCGEVTCLVLSPDGQTLAAGGSKGTITFWDTSTRKQRRTLAQNKDHLISLAFSPDGRRLAASGISGTLRVWDIAAGTGHKLVDESQFGPTPVAWSPDGTRLIVGGIDHRLHLIDVSSGRVEHMPQAHKGTISAVVFSPDGKVLASVDTSNLVQEPATVRFWRPDASARLQPGPAIAVHSGLFNGLAFSRDGSTLAVAGSDNAVRLLEVAVNRERLILRGHADRVISVAFDPAGRLLAAGCRDGTIHVWQADGGQDRGPLIRDQLHYTTAAFAPDGSELVVAGSGVVPGEIFQSTVVRYQWPSGTPTPLFTSSASLYDLAWSPDGQMLACVQGQQVHLHTLHGQASLAKWVLDRGEVRKLAFSSDGRWLAACTSGGRVAIRDQGTGMSRNLEGGPEKMYWSGLSFSPDGKTLAASGFVLKEPGEIVLWDVATGNLRQTLKGHTTNVTRVLFSPDGKTIASAGASPDSRVRLWNADGTLRTVLPRHSAGVITLAFDASGRVLASASSDGQIKLWDPKYGQERLTLTGHLEQVHGLAFHPTKPTLVSVSWDKTLRVWEGDDFGRGE